MTRWRRRGGCPASALTPSTTCCGRIGTRSRSEAATEIAARFAAAATSLDNVVLDGFHALKHALRFGAEIIVAAAPDPAAVGDLAAELASDVEKVLREVVESAAAEAIAGVLGGRAAKDVVAVARRPAQSVEAALGRPDRPVVLLDRPSFQGNVGAAVRVAAAADAAGVLVRGDVDPWNAAALRGSAGLHFALPVVRVEALPTTSRPLVAVHPEGEPLDTVTLPPGAVLAFGAERHGLGADLLARATRRVAIPMRAGVSSLNLATAVAVTLYAGRWAPPSLR